MASGTQPRSQRGVGHRYRSALLACEADLDAALAGHNRGNSSSSDGEEDTLPAPTEALTSTLLALLRRVAAEAGECGPLLLRLARLLEGTIYVSLPSACAANAALPPRAVARLVERLQRPGEEEEGGGSSSSSLGSRASRVAAHATAAAVRGVATAAAAAANGVGDSVGARASEALQQAKQAAHAPNPFAADATGAEEGAEGKNDPMMPSVRPVPRAEWVGEVGDGPEAGLPPRLRAAIARPYFTLIGWLEWERQVAEGAAREVGKAVEAERGVKHALRRRVEELTCVPCIAVMHYAGLISAHTHTHTAADPVVPVAPLPSAEVAREQHHASRTAADNAAMVQHTEQWKRRVCGHTTSLLPPLRVYTRTYTCVWSTGRMPHSPPTGARELRGERSPAAPAAPHHAGRVPPHPQVPGAGPAAAAGTRAG